MRLPLAGFRKRHPVLTRGVLVTALFAVSFGASFAIASWTLVCSAGRCPSVGVLEAYTPRQTSKVYAADGRFITELGLERRTLIKLADIPPVVRDAFLATEDKRFYSHHGIDFIRMFGAGLRNLRSGGYAQGFSTITMQLARNVFPDRISREKSLIRKLKEAKVALAIERRYSKDHILELYLNQIYLGNGAHGVETASQRYFGKSARYLNLAEAATLAALPKAPSRYDPRRFPDRSVQRRNTIIELMRQDGLVSDADASLAKAYPLQLAGRSESGDVAPYFVEWVQQQLDARFGQRLYEQGLKIYTTLDLDLQSAAERAMETQLRAIEAGKYGPYHHPTFEHYLAQANEGDAKADASSPYLQGAFVAMDPRTGAVLAMVGGRDFDDSKFNRATQALRQPGSTFKPIVYSDAIQNGLTPSYLVDDEPLSVPQVDGTDWTPQNFDLKFDGRMTLRKAFYESRNVPAIRVGMGLGEQNVIDEARKFGISTPIPPYPSINIGAADVYPIEMIAAYTTFATLGTRAAPFGITRVESADGKVLWTQGPQLTTILTPQEAWLMVDMMKDVVTKGSAAGSVGQYFTLPAGGKTGTTNDGADVWFIGYTSDLVAGLWIGLDKPAKIKSNAQGGLLAAPAWTAFMTEVYRRKPAPPDWPRPGGIVTREIDFTTNMLRTPYCPSSDVMSEVYLSGTEPTRPCTVHTAHGVVLRPDTTSAVVVPKKPIARDTTSPFYIPPKKKPGGGGAP
ncbi:MAG: penicillin-binding protein 1A [Gemmatimonadaceae bacterium]